MVVLPSLKIVFKNTDPEAFDNADKVFVDDDSGGAPYCSDNRC